MPPDGPRLLAVLMSLITGLGRSINERLGERTMRAYKTEWTKKETRAPSPAKVVTPPLGLPTVDGWSSDEPTRQMNAVCRLLGERQHV
jgi:hypothetical protein